MSNLKKNSKNLHKRVIEDAIFHFLVGHWRKRVGFPSINDGRQNVLLKVFSKNIRVKLIFD